MPISPARAAAFEILLRVETTDAYASELLHSARFAKLSPADHGLLTEVVMGVLRWRSSLDGNIAEHCSQPLAKLDREVLTSLRMGTYQLQFLERIPNHAAINESVELVKRARKKSAAGLVNAVLRKLESQSTHVSQGQGDVGQPSFVARSAHPVWLIERWERIYGPEITSQICEYNQSVPSTSVRVLAAAKAEGVQLSPGRLLSRAAVVTAGDISCSTAFREHRLTIQDEASQLVALLVSNGKSILDCCAAPGGKTRIVAERNPDATVIAMELHPHRAKLTRKLVREPNVHVIAADARQMPFRTKFDRILVDAPCSGTGTLARNPEIKWRLKPEDIQRLQTYQIEILNSATQLVAAGGRIIYSTCSLEPEENEQVIEKTMALNPLCNVVNCHDELQRLRDAGELVWRNLDSLLSGPYLRTIPGIHPCEGFFAAILQRH